MPKTRKSPFSEAKHPRDENGRFREAGKNGGTMKDGGYPIESFSSSFTVGKDGHPTVKFMKRQRTKYLPNGVKYIEI